MLNVATATPPRFLLILLVSLKNSVFRYESIYETSSGKEEPPRAGSFFVYLWLIFFLVAFVIRSFKPEFTLPEDLGAVSLQVLGIFFGSKASKKIYDIKTGKDITVALNRQDTIMGLVKSRGKITRQEVMVAIKVSATTAWRVLDNMEKKGLLKQVGEHKDTYYVLAEQEKT